MNENNLAEISAQFKQLLESADKFTRAKEAEAIKASFYSLLAKMREQAGGVAEGVADELTPVEEAFKSLYVQYKAAKAEYNRALDKEREENLEKKKAVIEDIKKITEQGGEATFPELRAIQDRWKAIGPVPVTEFRDLNETYQFYVEKFYDMVQINRDLRDLDFRKNLEAKTALCESAEKLSQDENVVDAFNELQKLHEQWKELGPVAREYREEIWARFKAATSTVNKRYQAFFEERKARLEENLRLKTELCEQAEEIASREITETSQWNSLSKDMESLQSKWRTIGFAEKKVNQKIYDRFREACNSFFEKKKKHYGEIKSALEENLSKKLSLIEQAEALKDSTEWKKATDQFIGLQKQWKEIGSIPRKKSEELWQRFRAACDAFFESRDAHQKAAVPARKVKEDLQRKYRTLQQDIETYENNIGFFADSKNADLLKAQMQERIDKAKEELRKLEEKIRQAEKEENNG